MSGNNGNGAVLAPEAAAEAALTPSQDAAAQDRRRPLELWHRRNALALLRLAVSSRVEENAILPPELADTVRSFAAKHQESNDPPPMDATVVGRIDDEIDGLREEIARSEGCPIRALGRRFGFSDRECEIVGFLFSLATSPLMASLQRRLGIEGVIDECARIGTVINALFREETPGENTDLRRLFHPSAQLTRSELVHFRARGLTEEENILSVWVDLKPRTINQIIGDDTSYAILSAHIEFDVPDVEIDHVILPDEIKKQAVESVGAWIRRRREGRPAEGISFLFYGPSGTGKTLLAQALAARFRLPLVRMKSPNGQCSGPDGRVSVWDAEDMARFIFREAHALGGIAFFDECDDIFLAGISASRCLLLEMERRAGLVILATNEPARLDPALDRRLTLRVPFSHPSRAEREAIWRVQLRLAERMGDDVDPAGLAGRFYFAGGYIRNAVQMALLRAEGRPVTQIDLIAAAGEQAIHFHDDFLGGVSFEDHPMPEFSLATHDLLEGILRVGQDARDRGESLWVTLRGPEMQELRDTAGAMARRLGYGIWIGTPDLLESYAPAKKEKEEDGRKKKSSARSILSLTYLLPPECAVGIEDSKGEAGIESLVAILARRGGIYFHLDSSGKRRKSNGLFDAAVDLEPPAADRRSAVWRAALATEGVVAPEAAVRGLAERYTMRHRHIAEAVRRARRRALMEGRNCITADIVAAAEEIGNRGLGGPLFG